MPRKKKEEIDQQPETATPPKRSIFAFVRSTKENKFSAEGIQYRISIMAEDGVLLHEFDALTQDDCRRFTRATDPDKSLDQMFTKHFPGGWKIHWVSDKSGNKELKAACDIYRKKVEASKKEVLAGQEGTQAEGQGSETGGQSETKDHGQVDGAAAGAEGKSDADQQKADEVHQGESEGKGQGGNGENATEATEAAGAEAGKDAGGVGGLQEGAGGVEIVHIPLSVDLSAGSKARILDELMKLDIVEEAIESDRKKANDKAKLELAAVEKSRHDLKKQYKGGDQDVVECVVERNESGDIVSLMRKSDGALVADSDWQPVLALKSAEPGNESDESNEPDESGELTVCMCDGNVRHQIWIGDEWKDAQISDISEGAVFRMLGTDLQVETNVVLVKDDDGKFVMSKDKEIGGIFKALGIAVWSQDIQMHICIAVEWANEEGEGK